MARPPDDFAVPGAEIIARDGARLRLAVSGGVNPVVRELAKHDLADVVYDRLSLDDLFMGFYGQGAAEERGDA